MQNSDKLGYSAQTFRAVPNSPGREGRPPPPKAARQPTYRERWQRYLTDIAPPHVDAGKHNDLGDAWRHYATSGILSRILSGIFGPWGDSVTVAIGDIGESGGRNPPNEAFMDRKNNRLGIIAFRYASDWPDAALRFMIHVSEGRIIIIDADSHQARPTRADDLFHYQWDGLDNKIRTRDSFDPFDSDGNNDFIFA